MQSKHDSSIRDEHGCRNVAAPRWVGSIFIGLMFLLTSLFAASCNQKDPKNSEASNAYLGSASEAVRPKEVVWVKYRSTPVDVAPPRFEHLDTSGSSLVTGAYYDASNSYLVIGLKGTYYHYCGVSRSEWNDLCSATSFGKHYLSHFKGRHDCRSGGVPEY